MGGKQFKEGKLMLKQVNLEKKNVTVSISIEAYSILKKYAREKKMPVSKLVNSIISEWIVKKKWKTEKI